jgi:signal transduction histidine kinase
VLSSGLAHDFRNITAGILLQVEDAEMELASGNPPGEQLASIKNAASRASEIVNQLMIYAGNENATLEPCNISSLVEQMVELLKVSIPKQVHLETQLDHDVSPVWGNATRIRQMIMNLVINASEAIGKKSGVIRVQTSLVGRNGAMPARSVPGAECLRLTVSDTGCGMSEEVKSRIFDPFFTTKPTGHGLGLAVIDGIVRAHNGAINVMSEPGHGTTFEVLLPILTRSHHAGSHFLRVQ